LVLFGDCFYLPHQEGEEAEGLFSSVADLLRDPPREWGQRAELVRKQLARLRQFCARLSELRHRPLFHALSRRAWELREEMDLLEGYLAFKSDPGNAGKPFHSDFHLPQTYRGGLVPRLQRLLRQRTDGSFTPTSE
jgi:hypothetical protein